MTVKELSEISGLSVAARRENASAVDDQTDARGERERDRGNDCDGDGPAFPIRTRIHGVDAR